MKKINKKIISLVIPTTSVVGSLWMLSLSVAEQTNYQRSNNNSYFDDKYSQAIVNFADWMKNVDSSKKLSELSIPGTHDSAMWDYKGVAGLFGSSWALTQSKNFSQQLIAGIRFFDIRVAGFHYGLALKHGPVWANTNLEAFFQSVKTFLSAHPSEVVLFRIQQEDVDVSKYSWKQKKDWEKVINKMLDKYKDIFFDYKSKPKGYIPTLGESRGKAIMFNNFDSSISSNVNYGPHMGNDRNLFAIQDFYDNVNATSKFNAWKTTIVNANESKGSINGENFYVNFLSWADGKQPSSNARQTLPLAYKWLRENPKITFTGITPMDYFGPGMVEEMVKRNYTWDSLQIQSGRYPGSFSSVNQTTPLAGNKDLKFNLTLFSQYKDTKNAYADIEIKRKQENQTYKTIYNVKKTPISASGIVSLNDNQHFEIGDQITVKYYQIIPANDYYQAAKINEFTKTSTVTQNNKIRELILSIRPFSSNNQIPEYNDVIKNKEEEFNAKLNEIWNGDNDERALAELNSVIKQINFFIDSLVPELNKSKTIVDNLKTKIVNLLQSDNEEIKKIFNSLFDSIYQDFLSINKEKFFGADSSIRWNSETLQNIGESLKTYENALTNLITNYQKINNYTLINYENIAKNNKESYLNSFISYEKERISDVKNKNIVNALNSLNIKNINETSKKLLDSLEELKNIDFGVLTFKNKLDDLNLFKTKVEQFLNNKDIFKTNALNEVKTEISNEIKKIDLYFNDFKNNVTTFDDGHINSIKNAVVKAINKINEALKKSISNDNLLKSQIEQNINLIGSITAESVIWKLNDSYFLDSIKNILKFIEAKDNTNLVINFNKLINDTQNKLNSNVFKLEDARKISSLINEITLFHVNNDLNIYYESIAGFVFNSANIAKEKEYYTKLDNLVKSAGVNDSSITNPSGSEIIQNSHEPEKKKEIENLIKQIQTNKVKNLPEVYKQYLTNRLTEMNNSLDNEKTNYDSLIFTLKNIDNNLSEANINNLNTLNGDFQTTYNLINSNNLDQKDYQNIIDQINSLFQSDIPSVSDIKNANNQLKNIVNLNIRDKATILSYINRNKKTINDLIQNSFDNSLYSELSYLKSLNDKINAVNKATSIKDLLSFQSELVKANRDINNYKNIISNLSEIKKNNDTIKSIENSINTNEKYNSLRSLNNQLKTSFEEILKSREIKKIEEYLNKQKDLITKYKYLASGQEDTIKTYQLTFVDSTNKEISKVNVAVLGSSSTIDLNNYFDFYNYDLADSSKTNMTISKNETIKLNPKFKYANVKFVDKTNSKVLLETKIKVPYKDNTFSVKNYLPQNYHLSINDSFTYKTERTEIQLDRNLIDVHIVFKDILNNSVDVKNIVKKVDFETKTIDISNDIPANYILAFNQPKTVNIANNIVIYVQNDFKNVKIKFLDKNTRTTIKEVDLQINKNGQNVQLDQFINNILYRIENDENTKFINQDTNINLISRTNEATVKFIDNVTKQVISSVNLPLEPNKEINLNYYFDQSVYELVSLDKSTVKLTGDLEIKLQPKFKNVTIKFIDKNNVEDIDAKTVKIAYKVNSINIDSYLPESYSLVNDDKHDFEISNGEISVLVNKRQVSMVINFKNANNQTIESKTIKVNFDQKRVDITKYVPTNYVLINEADAVIDVQDSVNINIKQVKKTVTLTFINEKTGAILFTKKIEISLNGENVLLDTYFDKSEYQLAQDEMRIQQINGDKTIALLPLTKLLKVRFVDRETFTIIGTEQNVKIDYNATTYDFSNSIPSGYHLDGNKKIDITNKNTVNILVDNNLVLANYEFIDEKGNVVARISRKVDYNSQNIDLREFLPKYYQLLDGQKAVIPYSKNNRIYVIKNSKIVVLTFKNKETGQIVLKKIVGINNKGQRLDITSIFDENDYFIDLKDKNNYFVNSDSVINVVNKYKFITINFVDSSANNSLVERKIVKVLRENNSVNVSEFIPKGYIYSEKNTYELNSKELTVPIKADKLSVTFKFINKANSEIISTITKEIDKDQSKYNVSALIPSNYTLAEGQENSVNVSNEINIYLQKASNKVIINFVDENNKAINKVEISTNSQKPLIDLTQYFDTKIYQLLDSSPYVVVEKEQTIKLKKVNKKVNLKFVENNVLIKQKEIIVPLVNNSVNISPYLPDNYHEINSNNIVKYNGEDELTINIKNNYKHVILNFKVKNDIVATKELEIGYEQTKLNVNSYLPEDYALANDQLSLINIKDSNDINVVRKNKTITITFINRDSNTIILTREININKDGQTINLLDYFDNLIYQLADKSQKEIFVNNNLTISLVSSFKDIKIKFINEKDFSVINEKTIKVLASTLTYVPTNLVPENYHLVDNNTYQINNDTLNILVAKNQKSFEINYKNSEQTTIKTAVYNIDYDAEKINLNDFLPRNFVLLPSQAQSIDFANKIVVLVKVEEKTANLNFVNSITNEVIKNVSITISKFGQEIDLSNYYDTVNYELENGTNNMFIRDDATISLVPRFKNIQINFLDNSTSKVINSVNIQVPFKYQTYRLNNEIPSGYSLVNGYSLTLDNNISKDFNVLVAKNNRNINAKLVDKNNNVIVQRTIVVGSKETNVNLDKLLPTNYHFVDTNIANIKDNSAKLTIEINDRNKKLITLNYVYNNNLINSIKRQVEANQTTIDVNSWIPQGYKLIEKNNFFAIKDIINVQILPLEELLPGETNTSIKTITLKFVNANDNSVIKEEKIDVDKTNGKEINLTNYFDQSFYKLGENENNLVTVKDNLEVRLIYIGKNLTIMFVDPQGIKIEKEIKVNNSEKEISIKKLESLLPENLKLAKNEPVQLNQATKDNTISIPVINKNYNQQPVKEEEISSDNNLGLKIGLPIGLVSLAALGLAIFILMKKKKK
ncbi:hypothetical protein [Mycoplasmopsis meleagridis]|uniref:hypothetical protein n=1 Tax=Mycoplasmopsis meleagridis TaxID=29561 RepID=UPI00073D7BE2|nr:hypothetical protein [Mycoplasmopsis meleagridis]KUH47360.1 hypothetical protein ASB56_01450 [Mycoplasmopsis meleagridis]